MISLLLIHRLSGSGCLYSTTYYDIAVSLYPSTLLLVLLRPAWHRRLPLTDNSLTSLFVLTALPCSCRRYFFHFGFFFIISSRAWFCARSLPARMTRSMCFLMNQYFPDTFLSLWTLLSPDVEFVLILRCGHIGTPSGLQLCNLTRGCVAYNLTNHGLKRSVFTRYEYFAGVV